MVACLLAGAAWHGRDDPPVLRRPEAPVVVSVPRPFQSRMPIVEPLREGFRSNMPQRRPLEDGFVSRMPDLGPFRPAAPNLPRVR